MDEKPDGEELIRELNKGYGIELVPKLSKEELENALAEKCNTLIRDDFEALVRLLYRIDINEARLRHLLKENINAEAGRIIARMIIDRLGQKIESRRLYGSGTQQPGNENDGEEKW